MQSSDNALTALVEERSRHYHFHGTRMFKWSGWIAGGTLIANILVPFGLAALLYLPESFQKATTLFLLGISGLSLALQLWSNAQHFRERAFQLRSLHYQLQTALADYRDGRKTDVELSAILSDAEKRHMQELAP